mmetsp:Transcript_5699/g.18266  ORF Transcript_5699/g.18266 Transcript_5699/m.18266 type:complete len:266 (-) Transcript_5699:266-1063(-)
MAVDMNLCWSLMRLKPQYRQYGFIFLSSILLASKSRCWVWWDRPATLMSLTTKTMVQRTAERRLPWMYPSTKSVGSDWPRPAPLSIVAEATATPKGTSSKRHTMRQSAPKIVGKCSQGLLRLYMAVTTMAWKTCSGGKSKLSRMRSHISSPSRARTIMTKGRSQKMRCHVIQGMTLEKRMPAPPMMEKKPSMSRPVKRASSIEKAHMRKKACRSRKMVNQVSEIQGASTSTLTPSSSQMLSRTSARSTWSCFSAEDLAAAAARWP